LHVPTDPDRSPGFGRLLAFVAGSVAVGVPLVAVAWHNLNHLLVGDIRLGPLFTFLAAGAGLALVLVWLGRSISRWGRGGS
jgi:hypothetical protein